MAYTIGSLFAGIGGIDLGFHQTGAEILWANEIDSNACKTYRANFGSDHLIEGDIKDIKICELPNVDVLTLGFPCQAFSIAGKRLGFEDERGKLFFTTLSILDGLEEKPKVVLIENVKNILTHDYGRTYNTIKKELENRGYYVIENFMNSKDYGNTPQTRERAYILGFITEEYLKKFEWPEPVKLTRTLNRVIKRHRVVNERYYYNENSQYFDLLNENVTSNETIYQLRRVYVRENKSKLSPTLTANMGTGGHNVPIIRTKDNRIRKLIPRECLLIQGFPTNFKIPKDLADAHIYKQAGNAVSVPVIKKLAKNIFKALEANI